MTAIHIILLCVGAALVCAMLRAQRPEMATMISICVGLGALIFTGDAIDESAVIIRQLLSAASVQSTEISTVLKASGITILGELGVQICTDAGESALAGRIRLACRVVILGLALPYIAEITGLSSQLRF